MSSLDNLYQDILSNLGEYIYVINLNDFSIQYISPALREKLGSLDESKPCYANFNGSNEVCFTCPRAFLSPENRSISLNIYHPLFSAMCNHRYLYSIQNGIPYLTAILSPEKALSQETDIERDRMYKVLTNITRILGPTENVESRLSECLDDIADFYNADSCCFYQINRNKTYNSQSVYDKSFLFEDSNIIKEWGIHFSQNRVLKMSNNKNLYFTQKLATMLDIKEIIAVSVKKTGSVVGFLYVLNPKRNEDFTILLSSAAPFIETEFDEDDKATRLDYLAYTDFMTGLKNRASFNDVIEELEKTNEQIGVVFVDINGLKQGNDTYGHEYGDKMIKTVAADLKHFFKKNIFRIGGDEFVVLMTEKTKKEFESFMANFKKNMQKDVSISLGYKWFENSKNIEKKISEVDKLMYSEKVKYYKEHDRRIS